MASFITVPINFVVDAWHKMLSCDPTRGALWSDWKVGLSCFAYLAPAIAIWCIPWNVRNCIVYEMTLYIVVSTNSFVADYIFMGKISMWHMLDRWTG